MGDIGKFIYDILFNPNKHILKKILNFVAILLVLVSIDYFFGFSFHYFEKSKLEEIEIISRINNNYKLDSAQSALIRNEFNKVVSKEANVYQLFDSVKVPIFFNSGLMIFLSYSWFLLFVIFFARKLIISGTKGTLPNNTTLLFQTFFIWIILLVGIWITSEISNWLQSKVGLLLLYTFNSASQLVFLGVTFFIVSLLPKNK
jgi:hypothetical protein